MGVGVTVVKMAEIRALELLASAEEHYYQSPGMLDIAAETANEKESISALDISDKKKCVVIKIKNKYKNY